MNKSKQNTLSCQNDAICSALQEIWDYIENKEYNHFNVELLNFANDIQFKIEQKINEVNSSAD